MAGGTSRCGHPFGAERFVASTSPSAPSHMFAKARSFLIIDLADAQIVHDRSSVESSRDRREEPRQVVFRPLLAGGFAREAVRAIGRRLRAGSFLVGRMGSV